MELLCRLWGVVSMQERTTLRPGVRGQMQAAASLNARVQNPHRGRPRGSSVLGLAFAGLVCAVAVLLTPAQALAVTTAPMCNEFAQSIEAPPTIWPHRGGSIQALPPCPVSTFWKVDANAEHVERIPPIVLREAPVAALHADVKSPLIARVQIPAATHLTLRPGHPLDVYRPPRG